MRREPRHAEVPGVTFYTVPVTKNVIATATLRSARSLNGGVTKALRAQREPKELTKVIGVLNALPAPTKVFDKIEGGGIYPGWVDAQGNMKYYQNEVEEYYFTPPLFEDEYYDVPKKSTTSSTPIYFLGKWYGVHENKDDVEDEVEAKDDVEYVPGGPPFI